MENHAQRPEVLAARANGSADHAATATPSTSTCSTSRSPVGDPAIGIVRVALPLTSIRHQLQPIVNLTLLALGLALGGAAAIAWVVSGRVGAPGPHHRRHRPAVRRGRPASAASRLRRRRARRRRAGAGRFGAGARPPPRRARSRSRADGGHPRRHDRRRPRRRSGGTVAAGQRGGAPHAPARRSRGRPALRGDDPAPAISALVAAALAGRFRMRSQLSRPATKTRTITARAAPVTAMALRARCWCCTTSPICGAPIKSAATSSPTCRTSCGRR